MKDPIAAMATATSGIHHALRHVGEKYQSARRSTSGISRPARRHSGLRTKTHVEGHSGHNRATAMRMYKPRSTSHKRYVPSCDEQMFAKEVCSTEVPRAAAVDEALFAVAEEELPVATLSEVDEAGRDA